MLKLGIVKRNGHKQIKSIKDLQPDSRNANAGTPRGLQMVEDSLRKHGAGRSILADKRGRVIAGNKTLQSASDINLPVRVVETDGHELVVVQRTDLDLDDPNARELAIADNRSSQVGLEWDAEVLAQLKDEGVVLDAMFTGGEIETLEFEAALLAEMVGGLDGKSEARNLGKVCLARLVINMAQVDKLERAISVTGLANRGAAIEEICEYYLAKR